MPGFGQSPHRRPRRRRLGTRLPATALLLAGACAALSTAAAASGPPPDRSGAPLLTVGSAKGASSPPLIGVSTPETSPGGQLVGVSAGGSQVLGVSTPETSPGGQLVGVSVGGQPTISVPVPATPTVEAPAPAPPPSSTTTTPTSPPAPPAGEGSHGSPGSDSGGPVIAEAASRSSLSPTGAHAPVSAPRGARLRTAAARASSHRSAGALGRAARSRVQKAGAGARAGTAALPAADRIRGPRSGLGRRGGANPLTAIGRHIPLPLPVPDWSKPIILALLLVAIGFAIRAQIVSRRARRLALQGASLREDVAALQAALVPRIPSRVAGTSVSVAYRPAEGPGAGGDFYDVFELSQERLAIIVGDVAGHGRGALERAALARYTLRAYMLAGLEPRAALALAGRALADPSCEHLTTVAVAVYDAARAQLTYALAGHPAPIVSGRAAREPVIACCSPPLGWSEPTGRRQSTITLAAGARACFFTDGLTEARSSGPDGERLLGRERLRELVEELGEHASAPELLGAVRAAAAATPDDMAACVLAPDARSRTEAVDVEELETDARALRAGHVAEFLHGFGLPAERIALAVQQALAIAAAHGTALLRVSERAGSISLELSEPHAQPADEASRAPAESLAEPPGALAAG